MNNNNMYKLCASDHDSSTVIGVIHKLDRRRQHHRRVAEKLSAAALSDLCIIHTIKYLMTLSFGI